MSKVRLKGAGAEIDLRRVLYQNGLRLQINYCVLNTPRRGADVAFPSLKVAIFVDGCFCHGCPDHATWPKQNADFWREKIQTNRARDFNTDERLHAIDWTVLRVWEHESPVEAAKKVLRLVTKINRDAIQVAINFTLMMFDQVPKRPHGNLK